MKKQKENQPLMTIAIPKSHIRIYPLNPRVKCDSFIKLRKLIHKQPNWVEIKEIWITPRQYQEYLLLYPYGLTKNTPVACSIDGIPLIVKVLLMGKNKNKKYAGILQDDLLEQGNPWFENFIKSVLADERKQIGNKIYKIIARNGTDYLVGTDGLIAEIRELKDNLLANHEHNI